MTAPTSDRSLMLAAMPGLFVFLWSTGFIGAKLGLPYIEPMTFLGIRFVIVAAVLLVLSYFMKAPWPRSWAAVGHIVVAGLGIHAMYLGGVFASIHQGVPAGVSALIVCLQPLLTAIAAGPFLGERITPRQWLGFVLGVLGVALVVSNKLALGVGTPLAMAWSVLALAGITGGTLYQKRFCAEMDLRTGSIVQYLGAGVVIWLFAWLYESGEVVWSADLLIALGWLTSVMSIGAVFLLLMLIRRGAASRVASLFYMVPPSTALIAYFLFGETLDPMALAGMAVAVFGVALINIRA